MKNLHSIQMQILRELIFCPNARFSDLNISELSNDHFSYHIRVLIEKGLVSKKVNRYSLTKRGKIFSAKINTENMKTEKQPKTSVLVRPILRVRDKTLYAVQKRLKEPYFGYYGFMTGKIRLGEKVSDAGKRELLEETNLAGRLSLSFILHEMVYDKRGKLMEDKYFHCLTARIKEDTLRKKERGCENMWMSKNEFMKMKPKYHNEEDIFNWFEKGKFRFIEETYFIEDF